MGLSSVLKLWVRRPIQLWPDCMLRLSISSPGAPHPQKLVRSLVDEEIAQRDKCKFKTVPVYFEYYYYVCKCGFSVCCIMLITFLKK